MSGGRFNYMYNQIDDTYCGKMEDEQLNQMMEDLTELLHDLEWYVSGDICEGTYRDSVERFKRKWFKQRTADVEEYIDQQCENLKSRLKKELNYLKGETNE